MKTWVIQSALLVSLGVPLLSQAQGDFEKGVSYYKQGQYLKAIQEFEKIVEANPDYESGYRILGDSYLRIREYHKAAAAFQNALRLEDDNYPSYYGLALAYYNSGKYRETAETLARAERYARSPRDRYQLFHTRGSAYYNLEEFARAIPDLESAVSIQRGRAEDILQLGISHYRLENYEQAEKFLTLVLALDSQSREARRYLSRLEHREAIQAIEAKNYREAAALLEQYVQENPEDAEAWFNLGLAQLFAENFQRAEAAFLKSTQLAPDGWEAYDRLGYIYEKTKRYDKSLKSYQKAASLHDAPRIKESIGRVEERIRRQRSTDN